MVQNEEDINTEQQEDPNNTEQIANNSEGKGANDKGKFAKAKTKKEVMALLKNFRFKVIVGGIAIIVGVIILCVSAYDIEVGIGSRNDEDNRKRTICCS